MICSQVNRELGGVDCRAAASLLQAKRNQGHLKSYRGPIPRWFTPTGSRDRRTDGPQRSGDASRCAVKVIQTRAAAGCDLHRTPNLLGLPTLARRHDRAGSLGVISHSGGFSGFHRPGWLLTARYQSLDNVAHPGVTINYAGVSKQRRRRSPDLRSEVGATHLSGALARVKTHP
jgi:hypothetical protein